MDEKEKEEIEISVDQIMKKVATCFPSELNRNQVTAILQLFIQIYY